MELEHHVRDALEEIGFSDIQVRTTELGDPEHRFRVTCTAPLDDGSISRAVRVEKLTWMSLPNGGALRIHDLEVRDRGEEEIRIDMDLRASAGARAV